MNYEEADAFIKARVSKSTSLSSHGISRSVPPKIRAHCFYSARVADDRILEKYREVSDAFSTGKMTQSEARHALRSSMKAAGQDDGSASIKNLASTARIDLVLTQNKRMAVAVGKYARDRDPVVEERFPCWKYHCGRNPRNEHKALDGKVFRKNDPIWRKIFPPWDFNCNCYVENSDEEPEKTVSTARLTPQNLPESGYSFDPSDAFEDYRVDHYSFDKKESGYLLKARGEAESLAKAELKTMYRDVENRQPGLIEKADDFWHELKPEEKDLISRYTASDPFDLNKVSRGAAEITDEAAKEMDELSAVLEKAPKYTGGTVYRVINTYDDESYHKIIENLNTNIYGLKGFNSTSVTMDAAKRYVNEKAKYNIIFHIVDHRNGAFIGHHSWINTDKEVLFDKKVKFRALKPWEKGYIKEDIVKDGYKHIAIMEV